MMMNTIQPLCSGARLLLLSTSLLLSIAACRSPKEAHAHNNLPAADSVLAIIHKVNNYWQGQHPNPGNAFWDNAAYHTGNMAAYALTNDTAYKNYSERWAIQNQWMGAKGTDRSRWKYTYGETDDHVLFGDWQICFQTYIDLYNLDAVKEPQKIALPANAPHRQEYIDRFKAMAAAIKAAQQPAGYWTRSMLDPQHAPGPETSGTAFFTFGILWGINEGVLDRATYLPVAQLSWQYLIKTALQPDGRVGYVQPIGERAIPGQVVDMRSTANFGVGAFLLAACEMHRLVSHKR